MRAASAGSAANGSGRKKSRRIPCTHAILAALRSIGCPAPERKAARSSGSACFARGLAAPSGPKRHQWTGTPEVRPPLRTTVGNLKLLLIPVVPFRDAAPAWPPAGCSNSTAALKLPCKRHVRSPLAAVGAGEPLSGRLFFNRSNGAGTYRGFDKSSIEWRSYGASVTLSVSGSRRIPQALAPGARHC